MTESVANSLHGSRVGGVIIVRFYYALSHKGIVLSTARLRAGAHWNLRSRRSRVSPSTLVQGT